MILDFTKTNGLIPAIIQDAATQVVLMLGYMDKEAFKKTQETKRVTFYSRSKQRLWTKGETSGNYLNVVDIKIDCDKDTLLIQVNPVGPVCHTGADTCFKESNTHGLPFLAYLEDFLSSRKQDLPKGSYTTTLFEGGTPMIAQKVGEEAVELVIEAMQQNDELFMNEAADLVYHLLVLLLDREQSLTGVAQILADRHQLK